ncbi:tonB-system energizer ExbB [Ancylobacter sp. MQZ15Z-1]|uniref:Biopolymer transport protein ExbB n=1 Tax=Ancylobacter mangrovi TaxID=2972472 RepID=A0A9X2P8S1_9HYPH|nr:tonB-system energizer ExbB [Ancylobacter mangrovi]MCS0494126.1 tonB-system energizer ExbB [Ancylobacter mangrovi]
MPTLRRAFPHPMRRRALATALICGLLAPAVAGPALAQQTAPAPAQTPAPAQNSAPAISQAPAQPAETPAAPATSTTAPTPAPATTVPANASLSGGTTAPPADDGLVPPMPSADGAAGVAGPAGSEDAGAAEVPPGTEDGALPLPDEDTSVSAQLPHDLSPWGMFMAADWIVKAVMIGLAFASVVTWTVWLVKSLELAFAQRRLRRALRGFLASASLDEARRVSPAGPAGAMLRATDLEIMRSGDLPADGIKERVSISLHRIEVGAGRAITRGTGLLATIGATAPFVGLFGTVWGIMNAFIGISKAQTTNLAVVAPGIAEALLATAIGLVAAIPAVVIYNHFTRHVSGYRVLMGDAGAEVLRLLSRDLDRRDVAARTAHAPARLRAAAE